jgi:TonB-dependent receptor
MQAIDRSFIHVRAAVRLALLGAGLALPAPAVLAADQQTQEIEEVVVTGFRGSLNAALAEKRNETAAIDVIAAEDIGKFPDSNLAESMQRIPGVALTRGDGGEGRNISVRGLGAQFTRVRINGMEGAAQTGSSDIYGAGNNGRSFDFNVFPSEIFSQLAVRKTPSADVEEGSLGATVDLKAPSAFDYDRDQAFSITGRGIYNEVAKEVDPRISMLASKKFFNETLGVLATLSYQERNLREVGYSAVDILHMGTNGNNIGTAAAPINLPFCTPIGWTATGPSPAIGSRGSTAANCSTNNPRTSDLAAFMEVYNRTNPAIRDAAGNLVPGGGAFTPRLPRYVNSEQDTERVGGSVSLEWRPTENTSVSLDGLMSRYQQERRDNYILGLSLGRNLSNNGQPMTSIRAAEFDDKGSLVYGLFDGMDVRSEGLVDQFVSKFEQLSLELEHHFNDEFTVNFYAGRSINTWDGPLRFQTFMDAIDTDNFSVDFRDGRTTPLLGFGFDVSDPDNFQYAPTPRRQPDGARRLFAAGQAFAEHHRHQHARVERQLAGDRLLESQARRAIPREPFQQPWREPDPQRHRDPGAAGRHHAGRHHHPDQGPRRPVRFGRAGELGGHRPAQVGRGLRHRQHRSLLRRVRRRAGQAVRRHQERLRDGQLRLGR